MPRLRLALMLAALLAGLVAGMPMLWHHLTWRRSPGRVLEAFVTPLGDGRARVSCLYDFTVDERGADVVAMGWQTADWWFRRRDDTVLPLAEAQRRAARVRARPDGSVFYRANDPEGTAFILLRVDGGWGLSGAAFTLLLLALALCLPPLRRARRSSWA